jgi:hypothetical protein
MSARSSTTDVASLSDPNFQHLVLEKHESQRAPGELSPANSSRAPTIVDEEKAAPAPEQNEPITHRPTGFRVRASYFKLTSSGS